MDGEPADQRFKLTTSGLGIRALPLPLGEGNRSFDILYWLNQLKYLFTLNNDLTDYVMLLGCNEIYLHAELLAEVVL